MATPETTAASGNTAPTRSLNALTIVSQQQVSLLVAQGRPEQAIGLLKHHLHDGGSPNPALYLELLSLLHTLGLRADFLHYHDEFERFFTGRIPEFSVFNSEAAPAFQTAPAPLDLLDLDLSELQQGPAGFGSKANLDVDIALPISDESSSEAPSAHLSPPSQHGNMIDFDPPEKRKHAPPRRA